MHILQPKHTKLTEKEIEDLLKKLNVSKAQLPKVLVSDTGLPTGSIVGDVVKIERKIGEDEDKIKIYYRVVI
jgi:DNA-directed RNA polymerase subunit H (RpoH/RPB5)